MLETVVAGAFLVAASAIAALDTAPARAVSYLLARRRRRRRQPEHDVRRRTGDRQRGGKARAGRTESPGAAMRGGLAAKVHAFIRSAGHSRTPFFGASGAHRPSPRVSSLVEEPTGDAPLRFPPSPEDHVAVATMEGWAR